MVCPHFIYRAFFHRFSRRFFVVQPARLSAKPRRHPHGRGGACAGSTGVFFARLSLQHRAQTSRYLETLQQEHVRPVLHAVLRPAADQPHLIELALSNHGKGSAHAVRLSAEPVAATPAAEAVVASLQSLSAVAGGLDILAAGETYGGVFTDFDILAARFAPAPFNGIIKISAEYQDCFGNLCATESVLDISALGALRPAAHAPARKPRKKLLY